MKVDHQNQKPLVSYSFQETQFIAVTAYQNEEVSGWRYIMQQHYGGMTLY